jgi:tRNA pseudouridine38-40 synthase
MIGYCGTGYHGMQVNPPHKTIEGDLYDAMIKSGGISPYNAGDPKKSGFMRAARTDKGVHAAGNLISLKMIIEDPDILTKINDNLPETIRVWGIERTNKAFDCRKMCGSRVYEYLMPTYAFIAPKPSSALAKRIKTEEELHPDITRKDPESAEFWEKYEESLKEANFTEEDLDRINNFKPVPRDEFDENDSTVQLIRRFKAVENNQKRSYRISKEKLDLMRGAMNIYLGHHNFHNFTLGKSFKDASASRYMKDITVSEPFVIDKTEWCSVKIHGQSFMLHQIRKMIAMATLVVRTGCPLERITEAFDSEKVNIPKAPALGLLLEQPVYEGYNQRLADFGYNPIDFTKYQTEMDAFKMKHIYDKVYDEEVKENVFNGFFNFIDCYQGDGVFDFLTAKGISKLEKDQQAEISIPTEKNEPKAIEE